ncbi:MAG TPA: hypothetical protein PLV24_05000, partial [Anaerolineaceae bacterium]|nr:hypothetical protein [Anaerolineaceae bacterium]
VILYGADIILSVFGGNFTVANLLVRVVFLVMRIGGFRAIAAVILYGADIILSVFGGNFTAANLLVRVVFLVMMIGGFRAIKELKAESSPAN